MGDAVCQTDTNSDGHNATDITTMQHDLEKLQEAHDKLLQELEEKRSFSDKLHSQLDALIEQNDSLTAQVQEKDQDLEKAVHLLKQSDSFEKQCESLAKQLKESEEKNGKLKQLAVKLKKELAEANEHSDRKPQTDVTETKDQLKQLSKENDRLSSLYQSSARNFQNLQSDFDKLQDEFENVVDRKKKLEQDLTMSVSEMSKLRVELEELKQERESLNKKVADLERDSEIQFNRRKEMEGKIIVLTNELEQERKKSVNQAGLERTLNELRCQLDLKTTELVDLGEVVERQNDVQEESQSLKLMIKSLQDDVKRLQEENEEVKASNWEVTGKLEAMNRSHEQERVRVVELLEELRQVRVRESQMQEVHSKNVTGLEVKFRDVSEQLKSTQATLSFTEQEFEAYKVKVCRVLSERNSSSEELAALKERIATMQSTIETLEADKELLDHNLSQEKRTKVSRESESSSRISSLKSELELKQQELDSLRKENSNFRTLSRELQCQLVSQRNQHEADLNNLREQWQTRESLLVREQEQLRAIVDPDNKASHVKSSTTGTQTEAAGMRSQRSADDTESVESSTLTTRIKRFSLASSGELGTGHSLGQDVILDEILNTKSDDEEALQTSILRRNESMERLQELLQEAESGSLLLTEQNRLLKEEIRRLERAMSRIEVAKNLEYLKNLLVKFISLEAGSSEKLQLVPVLKEILKLDSKEEKVLLLTAASDTDGKSGQANGWSFLWN